ncbi:hypothetical protein [Sphaerisporangium perillae]|nr:hypothetical protein [Sphaerisporangium perillae]
MCPTNTAAGSVCGLCRGLGTVWNPTTNWTPCPTCNGTGDTP